MQSSFIHLFFSTLATRGMRGGLMVSALDSGSSGPGSSSGRGHCVVFLGKTLYSTQVYKWVPANLMLGVTLRWTRGSGNTLSRLVASCYRNRDKLRPGGPHWPVCRLYLYLYLYLATRCKTPCYKSRFRHYLKSLFWLI